jgi:outer membrane protein OmpA-like peptidoglycan-associated protein
MQIKYTSVTLALLLISGCKTLPSKTEVGRIDITHKKDEWVFCSVMPGPWGCAIPTEKTPVTSVAVPMRADSVVDEKSSNTASLNQIVQAAVQNIQSSKPESAGKTSGDVSVSLAKSTYNGQPISKAVEEKLRTQEAAIPAGAPVVTVYFDFNSSILSGKASTELLSALDKLKGKNLSVHGFTDWTGTYEYNSWLAQRRADRVSEYVSKFAGSSAAFGHGLCCYTGSNETLDGRASNRRVDIYVIE